MNKYTLQFLVLLLSGFLVGCSVPQALQRKANKEIIKQRSFQTAHVGISIYDPSTKKYWLNYQGDKYFVPASNIKIPTCYAAMKYLGDSIPSAYVWDSAGACYVRPLGDPTFLLAEFSFQPLWDKIRLADRPVIVDYSTQNAFTPYGSGWSWDDYQEAYLAERSAFPIYGNVISFLRKNYQLQATPSLVMRPPFMNESMMQQLGKGDQFQITRSPDQNQFSIVSATRTFRSAIIPFKTKDGVTSFQFLQDTLQKIGITSSIQFSARKPAGNLLYSIPTDSLLKPLMHRSDNFFAEQSLLMVSQRVLNRMNEEQLIDTLLKTDFADLPQQPRWADGSGLSRYNLFSPQDFVRILEKMKDQFGMDRIKVIFPTGGEGTLASYYKQDSGSIYAKTGTLSGVVALSGYLYTKKGKLLLFSTLVNNHRSSSSEIRKQVENFLAHISARY
jgi:D-alanyl-D-alanine carboxypeptidase/D-alanyl-D-alanine-endopeptidase (penicillin-binding protein 4)